MSYEKEPITEAVIQSNAPAELPIREFQSYAAPAKTKIPGQALTSVEEKAKTPVEESVTLSPQLTALARKEAATRQREAAIKEREKQLEAKLAQAQEYEELKTKLASKDFSAAEKLGLTYEEYANYQMQKLAGEDPQKQELEAIRSEVTALKKQQEESVSRQYDANVAEYKKAIATLVESEPKFSGIKKIGEQGREAVLQYILDSFEEDGLELSVDQAAQDVQDFMKEEAKKMAVLLEDETPAVEAARKLPPPKVGMKTLTQQVTTSSERAPLKPLYRMSDEERWAEARRRVEARKQQAQG
ncbi:unnamed protein product [Sphagnum balticum]